MGDTAMSERDLSDQFFDIGNLVTISIEMLDSAWNDLRNAEPHGGRCAHAFTGDRYDWFDVPRVTISGSAFPHGGPYSFAPVGLKKRSYCGSFSKSKPSLAINLGRLSEANETAAIGLIGTKYITLNNSRQDDSLIRQALGYELFKRAGVPYSRCNFARVRVNGDDIGLYVNIEPVKEPYVEHNFQGNVNGNLYELEHGEDLTEDILSGERVSFEGFSGFQDRADLQVAAHVLATEGSKGMGWVIDTAEFLRFYAMEVLLKHWDGYSDGRNNSYIYNDVNAIAHPELGDVNLKFIPWGIDQTLQGDREFYLYDEGVVAEHTLADPFLLLRLRRQIGNYTRLIFGEPTYNEFISPLISRMEAVLLSAGENVSDDIESVREQLILVAENDLGVGPDWQSAVSHVLLST